MHLLVGTMDNLNEDNNNKNGSEEGSLSNEDTKYMLQKNKTIHKTTKKNGCQFSIDSLILRKRDDNSDGNKNI